jgi:hypothetical protein
MPSAAIAQFKETAGFSGAKARNCTTSALGYSTPPRAADAKRLRPRAGESLKPRKAANIFHPSVQ